MEARANILRAMRICRFCLSDDVPLTNIHEQKPIKDNKHFLPLPLQIMACVAIEVFANDGMPQMICSDCRTQTMQAYNFKTNCKKADDALKVFLTTGQLSKPYLKRTVIAEPKQTPMQDRRAVLKQEEKKSKHEKPDVITLKFDQDSGEQIIEHEQSYEEDQHMSTEDDNNDNINHTLKVKQVATDIFPCPQCERSFPLKQLRDLHMVNHDRERSFECEECPRRFFTKYDLNKHSLTHAGDKPFECVVCQKTFSRESLLHRHEKIHVDVPKYLCTQCDKTFLTRQTLDMHMTKHKKKRPYVCKICNKSFVFKQGLERHELVHDEDKPHKCNYCEASFNSAIKLTRHITTHAGLRPYPCKLCGRTFLLSHHLTRHMRSHYAGVSTNDPMVGSHKCDICSMAFRRKDSLINHSAIHSMVNLRCVICNTTFESAKAVKEHITTHLSELPYPCDKCDYSFETQDQLEEHEVKHAEMEYEDQIEKEVMTEARQAEEHEEGYEENYEDGEVEEYTLTSDLDNPEIIRKKKNYAEFLKDELGSDLEEPEQEPEPQPEEEEGESIKPIVRSEGTKVYTRKSVGMPQNIRRLPTIHQNNIRVASEEEINQPETNFDSLGLSSEAISALPAKKIVNMKVGDKMVRVQKFIVTKEEMKAMAKKGILEMKGGTVVLKNPGQPIMNATLKQVPKNDLESLLCGQMRQQGQMRTYQRREDTSFQKQASFLTDSSPREHVRYEEMETQEIQDPLDNSNCNLEQIQE